MPKEVERNRWGDETHLAVDLLIVNHSYRDSGDLPFFQNVFHEFGKFGRKGILSSCAAAHDFFLVTAGNRDQTNVNDCQLIIPSSGDSR